MNQRTKDKAMNERTASAHYAKAKYDALANRCIGPQGRESFAVRQMVRDAISARGIDPTCIQLAAGVTTFQIADTTFNAQGEATALRFQFNTLTVVYGISCGIRSPGDAASPDVWFFNIDRSQRNAMGQTANRASLSTIYTQALGGGSIYSTIQPMYGEYKVDWTGTLILDERIVFPQLVNRLTINLHGVELWQRSGPILGR